MGSDQQHRDDPDNFGVSLLIHKQTKAISHSFIAAALLFVAGTTLLMPWWGLWAPAGMTVVAYGYAIVSIHRKAQQIRPIDFRMPALLRYLTICIACLSFLTWGQGQEWNNEWWLGILVFTVKVTAVFVTGV